MEKNRTKFASSTTIINKLPGLVQDKTENKNFNGNHNDMVHAQPNV